MKKLVTIGNTYTHRKNGFNIQVISISQERGTVYSKRTDTNNDVLVSLKSFFGMYK